MSADILSGDSRALRELSLDELDDVSGGFLPLVAAAAEGALVGFAAIGVTVVAVAAGVLVYHAVTGKTPSVSWE